MKLTMTNEKEKRTALVTGSGRNIGRAIAIKLADDGCNIILNGSQNRAACEAVAREIESKGGNVFISMGNVGVRDEAIAVVENALEQFNRVDVLVNNAAIRPSFDLVNDDEEDFSRIMDINFYAAFWLSRVCLPGMINNGWGRIINFTGMNAQQGYTGKSAVSISKHASWGLTKSIAKEYAKHGITANIISPGTILDDGEDVSSSSKYDALLAKNPSGRLGQPDDIAMMVRYLAGYDSGFVNGQMMQVNGGVIV